MAALAAEGTFSFLKEFSQRLKPIGVARSMYELKLVPFTAPNMSLIGN
jgi:hypothetical protein